MLRKIIYKMAALINLEKDSLKLYWLKGDNFGDVLNPILLNRLTNKKVQFIKIKYYENEHYLCIGSSLSLARKNTIVWGAGFIDAESKCYEVPKKIYAVRGPKTRKLLLEQGIDCPEVYGDPALLLPYIYRPKILKKYKLGIIPHFADQDNIFLEKFRNNEDILIIDILEKDPFLFINNVLSCEKIASSSLHGIVVADAYKIPSLWIEFSDKVLGKGFKFQDYFESINRLVEEPLKIDVNVDINYLMGKFIKYELNIDLNKLIDSSPFEIKL